MAVNGINFFSTLYGQDLVSSKANTSSAMQGLDRDAFLKLMVAQFVNQDPLSPMSDAESIAQLAQFSSLEQMTNLVDSMEDLKIGIALMLNQSIIAQGASMIGKEVTGYVLEETLVDGKKTTTPREVTGLVTAVLMKNGFLNLKIGDDLVPIDTVKEIREPNPEPPKPQQGLLNETEETDSGDKTTETKTDNTTETITDNTTDNTNSGGETNESGEG